MRRQARSGASVALEPDACVRADAKHQVDYHCTPFGLLFPEVAQRDAEKHIATE